MFKTIRPYFALSFALLLIGSTFLLPCAAMESEKTHGAVSQTEVFDAHGELWGDLSQNLPGDRSGDAPGGVSGNLQPGTDGARDNDGAGDASGNVGNGGNGGNGENAEPNGNGEDLDNQDYRADENGRVLGVSEDRGSAWSVVWGIVIALLIAAAVVAGVVLLVPSKNEK